MASLNENTFYSIATGEPYTGKLPDEVSAVYSEPVGQMMVTKIDTAKKDDPNYDQVLVAYMYARGYIRPRKSEIENDAP